jgi:anaerobic magnesium-protoporphyrin IX monomethyl ester cyclase
MNYKNEILLIFPPIWLPDVPFLSTPILSAYLKKNSINVKQVDLNIEFWNYLYKSSFISDIYKTLKRNIATIEKKENLTKNDIDIFKKLSALGVLTENNFIKEIQQKIIPVEIYLELINKFSKFGVFKNRRKLSNCDNNSYQDYHDFFYNSISFSIYSYSSLELKTFVESKENPYYDFFIMYLTNNIVNNAPKIIGISITANNQVVPAFTLAKSIKTLFPNTLITIGGSWCSLVNNNLGHKLNSFPYIDFMIPNEGEIPLLELTKKVFDSNNLYNIRGVYFKNKEQIYFNKTTENIKMSDLVTPDFSDLKLNFYFEKDTLPIQYSRGCYWGKCIFCSYPILEPKYKQRGVDLIIKDIINLQKTYNTKIFSFADSLISPAFANIFCDLIIKNRLIFEWVIFARFEKQFSKELLLKMKKCGCTTICWGLESGNKRVLKEINKNIILSNVKNVLDYSSDAKIHNRVLVMYGLPTECLEEAYDTIHFIRDNIENIHSLAFNLYHPEKNTPIEMYFKKNKLNPIIDPNKDLSIGYDPILNIDLENISILFKEFKMLNNLINNKNHNNFNFNDITELTNNKGINNFDIKSRMNSISLSSILSNYSNKSKKRCFFEINKF